MVVTARTLKLLKLVIARVSNSCRVLFGIVAKLSNVGRGFILRCKRQLLLTNGAMKRAKRTDRS